jgi:hypothetical protein
MPGIVDGMIDRSEAIVGIPMIPNWMVDLESESKYLVTSTYFGLDAKSLFFDKRSGEIEPAVEIPDMPMKMMDRTERFQAFVSTYVLDSFFASYLSVGNLGKTIPSTAVPATSSVQLNTSDTTMNLVFPGIKKYYGPDIPLDAQLNLKSLGNFEITASDSVMAGLATMEVEIWANKADGTRDLAVSLTLGDLAFGFSVLVTDMLVSAQITEMYVGTVKVNSCSFGRLSALKLKLELNKGFKIAQPIINSSLAGMHIPVPSNIGGVFELHDLNLSYFDSYLYAGATPIFLAPSFIQ